MKGLPSFLPAVTHLIGRRRGHVRGDSNWAGPWHRWKKKGKYSRDGESTCRCRSEQAQRLSPLGDVSLTICPSVLWVNTSGFVMCFLLQGARRHNAGVQKSRRRALERGHKEIKTLCGSQERLGGSDRLFCP